MCPYVEMESQRWRREGNSHLCGLVVLRRRVRCWVAVVGRLMTAGEAKAGADVDCPLSYR